MATKDKKEPKEVKMKKFTMETEHLNPKNGRKQKGESINIIAPEDSLDEDGDAESALEGVYRHG